MTGDITRTLVFQGCDTMPTSVSTVHPKESGKFHPCNKMTNTPRPILVHKRRSQRQQQQQLQQQTPQRRRVRFESLDWQKEAERSERGHEMRKALRQQMVQERRVRQHEHRDRKRVIDVLQSMNPWVQAQVEEMLREGDQQPNAMFTSVLRALLIHFGAPTTSQEDVRAMIHWFRSSSIRYTKQLRCQYEFAEPYLLYLGQSQLFQKRFLHVPPAWLSQTYSFSFSWNPTFDWVACLAHESSLVHNERCLKSTPIGYQADCEITSNPLLDTIPSPQDTPSFDNAYGFCKATANPGTLFNDYYPTLQKRRGARQALRSAFQLIWLTLSRRRSLDFLGCLSNTNVVDTSRMRQPSSDASTYKVSDKILAPSAVARPVFAGVMT